MTTLNTVFNSNSHMSIFHGVALLAICLVIAVVFTLRQNKKSKGTKHIPGPAGYPLLGNLPQIPQHHSWLKFKEWSDEYGPLFCLRLGGQDHVVISTEKIANDLLRERGTLYSSREQSVMAAQLLSRNLRPLLLPYNDHWRRVRKMMHQLTMPAAATTYEAAQSLESKRLLYQILKDPSDYQQIFEQFSGGLVFRIGYGKAIITGKEDQLRRILEVIHNLERIASPGAYLVDILPVLNRLPSFLAPFKREAERLHLEEIGLFRELLEDTRASMAKGVAAPSFARTFLEEQEKFQLNDDEGAYVLGTLFEAASGTTAAAMQSLCLALTLYPDWQKVMWKQLDEVCGNRLPEFGDIPKLPAVRAVVKEVLRWRPVTAGGIPHKLTQDDVYDGFLIRAGTLVHANQWAIHRDPTLYPDPEVFNPNRWLSSDYPTYREPLVKYPTLQNFSCFGFGRRICPGMNIAERSLFILTARIAWACEFSRKRAADGTVIDVPDYDYIAGFNTQPKPFPFVLKARSEARWELVNQAWKEAEATDPLRKV